MEQPLVSVVIPIYNVEAYLNRCIDSVVNQTYTNLEIILVDDGSPDRCPAMCDEWARKDSRIQVIHKENAGLGMARNSGIDVATGKYIFFFDSDDYVSLNTVELCVGNAEEYGSDAVVYGRWDVYEDGRKTERPVESTQNVFSDEEIIAVLLPKMLNYGFGFGVSSCGKMYKLQTLTGNNLHFLSEREVISEDTFFALSFFSKASKVTLIVDSLYYYMRREGSLSRSYMKDRHEKNNDFLNKCLAFIENNNIPMIVASHLKVRYHAYSLAAMKQTLMAQLSEQEKKAALMEIMGDTTLRNTLTLDVLKIEKPLLRVFWLAMKLRLYNLCILMLKMKMRDA